MTHRRCRSHYYPIQKAYEGQQWLSESDSPATRLWQEMNWKKEAAAIR